MNKKYVFPCEQCGAKLTFSVATGELRCPYCTHVNHVERAFTQVVENDYNTALRTLENLPQQPSAISSMKCPTCAATFELHENIYASECPFCGSAVINEVARYRPIQPQALLPFKVSKDEARHIFKTWLKSHWFAPNKLQHYGAEDSTLKGVFIPYWTYDADTFSRYSGRRGKVYYKTQQYQVYVNGRSQMRSRRIERVRWTPVSGNIDTPFDDVLVMASESLHYALLEWDLEHLVNYDEAFLSGYESEVYTINLERGFERAKATMEYRIRAAIKRQIGGDRQEITTLQTRYSDITFKHILLPVYASAFTFNNKLYRYVINGRNGAISGERPYSMVKIVAAVTAVLAIVGVLYYLNRQGFL
ncbi:MAG: primosomal protein N' (replication factor Y) - superfamily II helicase [Sulfurimonas sp.]|nr:MAG: primosomal protein N' (replication factor Y) - superfamily II helicase [Sulfurimonas sp.]